MHSDVSVVICAYTEQRWPHLVASVAAAQHQTLPAREVILVIDYSAPLLERARATFAGVRVIENRGQRGLSCARNTGVAAARGQLVAFVDDDGVIAPDWLERLSDCLREPDVLGAGGAIAPCWEAQQPAWFPAEFNWVIGCTYTGLPRERGQVRNPIGGCMIVRREVFDAVGGFRIDMGRIGTKPLGCEETELCIRAKQRWPQSHFVYEPAAVMRHMVPETRARWAYFRSRCYHEGISKAMVGRFVGRRQGLAAERAYTLKTLPQGVLRGIGDVLLHGDWSGGKRVAAIIAGLAYTSAGYVGATLRSNRGIRQAVARQIALPPTIEMFAGQS